jgi:hypothetical protein
MAGPAPALQAPVLERGGPLAKQGKAGSSTSAVTGRVDSATTDRRASEGLESTLASGPLPLSVRLSLASPNAVRNRIRPLHMVQHHHVAHR